MAAAFLIAYICYGGLTAFDIDTNNVIKQQTMNYK